MAKIRITPTCVGNTRSTQRLHSERRDHPHMCGENRLECPQQTLARDHPHMCGENEVTDGGFHGVVGSPPHVWGKQ